MLGYALLFLFLSCFYTSAVLGCKREFPSETHQYLGVLQTKVNSRNEKSPAKFARLKEGITKQTGEKTHRQPG